MENRVTIRQPKPGSTVVTKLNRRHTRNHVVIDCGALFFGSFLWRSKEMNRAGQGSKGEAAPPKLWRSRIPDCYRDGMTASMGQDQGVPPTPGDNKKTTTGAATH